MSAVDKMFSRTRADGRKTRSGVSLERNPPHKTKAVKRKSLPGPADSIRSKGSPALRSRSQSPGAAAGAENLKSRRGRGRPAGKKLTATSLKQENLSDSGTETKVGASKLLPKKAKVAQSVQDSEGDVGVSPRTRGRSRKPIADGSDGIKEDTGSPKAESKKRTSRGRSLKDTCLSPEPGTERKAESPSGSKKSPLRKQISGKKESRVSPRKSLSNTGTHVENVKTLKKGVDSKDEDVECAPVSTRGKGQRNLATRTKDKKTVTSTKVGRRQPLLTRAKKLAAQAKQVKRVALRKGVIKDDESENGDDDDELLAEPSVFKKFSRGNVQQKITKVEIGSLEDLKKPGKDVPEVKSGGSGILQGRIKKGRVKKSTYGLRKKTSRELAALTVDPGFKLAETKLNTSGRLRSVGPEKSNTEVIKARVRKPRGQAGKEPGLAARSGSPGSEPGSDTASLASAMSQGRSASSETDKRRRRSPAARLRCPFLATRSRRTKNYSGVQGPRSKFTRLKDSTASDSASVADQSSPQKEEKTGTTTTTLSQGRAGRRRSVRTSRSAFKEGSRIVDSSLSEKTSTTESENLQKSCLQLSERTDTSVVKPTSGKSVDSVRKSGRVEKKREERLLSPTTQSMVRKSFSLKTIEKFRKAFKLVDPVGKIRSTSKDSASSVESEVSKTVKGCSASSKGDEIPVDSKGLDCDQASTSMVGVYQKPAMTDQDVDTAQPAVENDTKERKEAVPVTEQMCSSSESESEILSQEKDSETSFRLELSIDSITSEDLKSDDVGVKCTAGEGVVNEQVMIECAEVTGAVKGENENDDEARVEEESRPEEPMEISEENDNITISMSAVVECVRDTVSEEGGAAVVASKSALPDSESTDIESDPPAEKGGAVADAGADLHQELKSDVEVPVPSVAESDNVTADLSIACEESVPESKAKSAPVVPESKAKSAPEVPESKAKSEPVVAESKTKSEPVVAESKAKSEPVVPESKAKSEPAVPESKTESTPAFPESKIELSPAVPESKTESTPAVPESKTKSAPVVPESKTESTPVVPESKTESTPVVLESKTESTPVVPESKTESAPVVPESKTESTPVVPESKTESTPVVLESKTRMEDLMTSVAALKSAKKTSLVIESPDANEELPDEVTESPPETTDSNTIVSDLKSSNSESKALLTGEVPEEPTDISEDDNKEEPAKKDVEKITELVREKEPTDCSDEVKGKIDVSDERATVDSVTAGDNSTKMIIESSEKDNIPSLDSVSCEGKGSLGMNSRTDDVGMLTTSENRPKENMAAVEDAIAKAVQETVESIIHGVEYQVGTGSEADKNVELQEDLHGKDTGDREPAETASTSHPDDAVGDDGQETSRKGPIILKIKTSSIWEADGDGTSSESAVETHDDAAVGDGVVVSSSQEVSEASGMSKRVKDALLEVNKTLAVVATQEIAREETSEKRAASVAGLSDQPSDDVVAKEEEAVTSTGENAPDVKKGVDEAAKDECPAVKSSKEDGVSCSCHPSEKQEGPAAVDIGAPKVAVAPEAVAVEEGGQEQHVASPPKLAAATMSDVERRIEEIQAMVSDIQKQIKTGTGTGKVLERRSGLHVLDDDYTYGPSNIHSPEEKGDLKLTIKLGGKKGDAKSEFKAADTNIEKKLGKKHVAEPKIYPKRHVPPKYSEIPWIEYSESYFEDMARKQKKSLAKLEGKQEGKTETPTGETRPKRKPVTKTEYELYLYELKNPKRRKHKPGPASATASMSTIESIIDEVNAHSLEQVSNIPELMKQCKPCSVVLEDFVVSLNLSALKRKGTEEGSEVSTKCPKLNIGIGVDAQIDTQTIAEQLTPPEKRRRMSGSRSGRRASGSSSAGSIASELESGRLSPSSPRPLDVPASRLSPKPHKRKINRTGFPRQPRKNYYVYQCKFCPYSTNYRIAVDDHVYTHLDIVPFRCGYCNSVFGAKSGAVAHHKKNHQNLPLRCIKSVEVDESQYYNYVYVSGQRKSPVSPRSMSPSRSGSKETRNVFESIMKEIPVGSADSVLPLKPVAPLPVVPSAQGANTVIQHVRQQLLTKTTVQVQPKPSPAPVKPATPAQTVPKPQQSDKLPVYQCKFCKFSTDHRNVIELHLQNYHEEEYRFICPLCDLAFCKREETMVKHFKKWHPDKKVQFKRAAGFKNYKTSGDGQMSYASAAMKSLRPDLNDVQVSNRPIGTGVGAVMPAAAVIGAASQNKSSANVGVPGTPLLQSSKQQSLGSSHSQSFPPGPEATRKSGKPSITDIAANLASKVGGFQSDEATSGASVFLNIPSVRSRGSSPSAPDRNQGAVPVSVVTGTTQKPEQDAGKGSVAGKGPGVGILDLSASSREPTPLPAGVEAQDDVSNIKIVNVVSLSTQEAVPTASSNTMDTEETEVLSFSCKNCNNESLSLDSMIKHIEIRHSEMDFWFACPYCPYGCSKHRGNMVRHIRRAHPGKEANEVDIHLIDEAKYITKRVGPKRQPVLRVVSSVPVVASGGQSSAVATGQVGPALSSKQLVPVLTSGPSVPEHSRGQSSGLPFPPIGSTQMIAATQLAMSRSAPPLIRAPVSQQRNLPPPPLIRAVAVTTAASSSSIPNSSASSSRPGSSQGTTGTPPSQLPVQQQGLPVQIGSTIYPPPNAQVYQGVPQQGVTHLGKSGMSGGSSSMGVPFPVNLRMPATQAPRPKLREDNISPTEQEKFSVFNIRPTKPSVVYQSPGHMMAPIQPGMPVQYGQPGMIQQQRAYMPVQGQSQGQVPYRPSQPPSS